MNDNETLKAIEEGLQDIKNGRVIKFEDFSRKPLSGQFNV
jgi:predicted transcriptional regulator